MMRHIAGALLGLGLVSAGAGVSWAQEDDAAARPSVIAPLAEHSLLLDLAWAGDRAVAVGERGHILLSDDRGVSWKQVPAPVSANLTAVYFSDAEHGWAVGHDETILRTVDGGLTWERVHFDPEANRPLLDVWFGDSSRGLAVGAYGAVYASNDGGATWEPVPFEPQPLGGESDGSDPEAFDDELDLGFDFHLNAIGSAGDGVLYLAAEAGRLFRSDDGGLGWRELPSPYDGSFYGIQPLGGDSLLAFGLRGHVFRSDDGGAEWTEVPTGTVALLGGSVSPVPGTVLIAGLTGVLLVSTDGGRSFSFSQQEDRKGLSSLLWAGDGEVIVAGEGGVRRLAVPGLR